MTTLHLRPRDGYPELIDAALAAGWDTPRLYREFGVRNQDELQREAVRRGGWAYLALAVRTLAAKYEWNAQVDATQPDKGMPVGRASELLYSPWEAKQ